MKKLFNILLVLVLVCSFNLGAALPVSAEEIEPPEGINWDDWDIEDGTIYGYYGDETEITVPAVDQYGVPVTELYSSVFMDNTTVKKIVVSEGIEMIGGQCFRGCTALEECVLPQSVNTFTWGVNFSDCTNLKKVNLPAALEEIPLSTFSGCRSLSEIIITYGIKRIQPHAFCDTQLKRVVLPETVEQVTSRAFSNLRTEGEFELIICNPNCELGGAYNDEGVEVNLLGARNEIECRVIGHENSTAAEFYAQEGILPETKFVAKSAEYFENLPENQVGYGVDIDGDADSILLWIIIAAAAVVVLAAGAVVIVIVIKKTKSNDEDEDLETEE